MIARKNLRADKFLWFSAIIFLCGLGVLISFGSENLEKYLRSQVSENFSRFPSFVKLEEKPNQLINPPSPSESIVEQNLIVDQDFIVMSSKLVYSFREKPIIYIHANGKTKIQIRYFDDFGKLINVKHKVITLNMEKSLLKFNTFTISLAQS